MLILSKKNLHVTTRLVQTLRACGVCSRIPHLGVSPPVHVHFSAHIQPYIIPHFPPIILHNFTFFHSHIRELHVSGKLHVLYITPNLLICTPRNRVFPFSSSIRIRFIRPHATRRSREGTGNRERGTEKR